MAGIALAGAGWLTLATDTTGSIASASGPLDDLITRLNRGARGESDEEERGLKRAAVTFSSTHLVLRSLPALPAHTPAGARPSHLIATPSVSMFVTFVDSYRL